MNNNTFVYSPDVRVYISTITGMLDVSRDVVSFDLTRRVSATSTFDFELDNRRRSYSNGQTRGQYDGVIRPMDRIVVFLKRITWLQVFAGYISTAPLETVLPGTVNLTALCTLKRLENTYWDPNTPEAFSLLPGANANANTIQDGGAGTAIFNILAQVVKWEPTQIHIQKIPDKFIQYGATLKQKVIESIDQQAIDRYNYLIDGNGVTAGQTTPKSIPTKYPLPATNGRISSFAGIGTTDAPGHMALSGESGTHPNDIFYLAMRWHNNTTQALTADEKSFWLGQRILIVPDRLPQNATVVRPADVGPGILSRVADVSPQVLRDYLQIGTDETVSLSVVPPDTPTGKYAGANSKQNAYANTGIQDITKLSIQGAIRGTNEVSSLSPGALAFAFWVDAQAQTNNFKYAISSGVRADSTTYHSPQKKQAIDFGSAGTDMVTLFNLLKPLAQGDNYQLVELFGPPGLWKEGKPLADSPLLEEHQNHVHAAVRDPTSWNGAQAQAGGAQSGSDGGGNAFNIAFRTPTWDQFQELYTGNRAFVNDEKVLLTIQQLSQAALREFMSTPTGDFMAWFPDPFGLYGKTAMMAIRDIEIVDFRMSWSDDPLATHVGVAGDMEHLGQTVDPLEWISTYGIVTMEQPEVIKILLGLDPSKDYKGFDPTSFLNRYGMRPKVEEIPQIRDQNWEYFYALQLFMKQWSAQYNSPIQLTFMPEIFPGMRLDIADHNLRVYVEEVAHSGSRTRGFSTQVTVSCPVDQNNHLYVLNTNPVIDNKTGTPITDPSQNVQAYQ